MKLGLWELDRTGVWRRYSMSEDPIEFSVSVWQSYADYMYVIAIIKDREYSNAITRWTFNSIEEAKEKADEILRRMDIKFIDSKYEVLR
jgi:hypothetical protein